MRKWARWAVLISWTAGGAAYAEEESARVIRSISLPSFGFGTVSQTAEVHGSLPGRYETVAAQQDPQSFVDLTEGHFQVPGGIPPSMIPDPFVPSVLEYVYEVHLPEGFELRTALPEDQAKKFGPAILTGHAARATDGALRFSIRLDTTQAQFPPATAAEFRKELAQSFEGSPGLRVAFDLSAYELNNTGESVKALAAYEQRVAKRPDDAIEHIRLAVGLKTLGLMDRALAEANTAVRLDPHSPPSLLSLARLREADPLGRMFQPGFDRDGALEVLRRLATVDPNYLIGRYELVILLEYDTDGVRYSYAAPLAEAANELLELRTLPGYEDRWDSELLQLLGMTGQFDKIPPLVSQMRMTEQTRNWLLASVFYVGGEKAARKAAASISLDKAATARAFYGAAGALEIARQYDKARALMMLSSVDAGNASYRAEHLQILSRIKRHEEEALDETDPVEALRKVVAWMMRPAVRAVRLDQILSRESLRVIARDPSLSVLPAEFGTRELSTYTQMGYGVDQAIDVFLSNANPVAEGDAQYGYVVRGHNRSDQEDAFVVVENGKARLLATSQSYQLAGPGALARANAGLNDETLAMLSWAAKFANSATTGDPLGAAPLTHFWPIPKDAGTESILFAAAALAASLGDPNAAPVLVKGRSAAASHTRELDFDIALAADYFAQQDWKDLAPVAERLASAYPDSVSAFKYRTAAYRGLQDWKKADAATAEWLTQHKNDPDGIMARAFNATYQGKWHEARAMLAPLVAAGTATTSISNQFAWLSVATNEVDESAVQAAREVSNEFARRKVQAFSVNHTLACVYALSGRPKEALDVLIKAMDAAGMAVPDSATWFAQGLIAEAYGDVESAASYYQRVQANPLRDADPVSSYNLAQRRLEKLSSSHK